MGDTRGCSKIAFLEAGHVVKAVSPIEKSKDVYEVMTIDGVGNEKKELVEEEISLEEGEEPVRIGLQKDGEFLKKINDPLKPTEEEVKEHFDMGHAVYRNWCSICVEARGKEMDCRRDDGKDRKLPEYSWDYCFPGDEHGYRWTVLV